MDRFLKEELGITRWLLWKI